MLVAYPGVCKQNPSQIFVYANGYSWNCSIRHVLAWIISVKRAARWPIRNFRLPRTVPSTTFEHSFKYILSVSDVWLTGLVSDIIHTPYPIPWFMSLWHFVGLKVTMCRHESPGYLGTRDHTCALLVLNGILHLHARMNFSDRKSFWTSWWPI